MAIPGCKPEAFNGQAGLLNPAALSAPMRRQAQRYETSLAPLVENKIISREQANRAIEVGVKMDDPTWQTFADTLAQVRSVGRTKEVLRAQSSSASPHAAELMTQLLASTLRDGDEPRVIHKIRGKGEFYRDLGQSGMSWRKMPSYTVADRAMADFRVFENHHLPTARISLDAGLELLSLIRKSDSQDNNVTRGHFDDILNWLEQGGASEQKSPAEILEKAAISPRTLGVSAPSDFYPADSPFGARDTAGWIFRRSPE